MSKLNPNRRFNPIAEPSSWRENGESIPVIRIYGGGASEQGVVVSYAEARVLADRLVELKRQHEAPDYLLDNLFLE